MCAILIKCQDSMHRTSFLGLFGEGVNIQTAQFRWLMVDERELISSNGANTEKTKYSKKISPKCHFVSHTCHTYWPSLPMLLCDSKRHEAESFLRS